MSRKIILVLIVFFLAVMAFSCFMIFKEVSQSEKEKETFEKLEEIVMEDVTESETSASVTEENKISKRNLAPLFEQNPDCIGWVFIEETRIDYPVMHTPENPQKYLRKSFEGEYAMSGVPFLEGTGSLEDDNIVIYGHNMKNGTMFSDITCYTEKEFWEQHRIIEFETAEGLKNYRIFAAVRLKATDIWYYFGTAFNEEHFDELIADIKSRALYETGIYPEYGKQIITLSTCYGENDDDRLIIIGTEE